MRFARAALMSVFFLPAIGTFAADPPTAPQSAAATDSNLPTVLLRDAPPLKFPVATDSNSPAHWDGETFYLFSSAGSPKRSSGADLFHLGRTIDSRYNNTMSGGRWIECTWKAGDGTLYAWYHHEPTGLCPGTTLTAPKIGAVRSKDNGATFEDLGIILEAPPGTLRCDAKNGYFAGGHGDFSAMLEPEQEYLYFFFGNYAGKVAEQGVAVARMRWADRNAPAGKVSKWHAGKWEEKGVGGRVTPIFPAAIDWARADADAFWGPSIHWNTHLERYVILLNRTKDKPGWPQEGIYVSFSRDLADPTGWTAPKKIHDKGAWYPQVIGLDASRRETDKLAGRVARFFMAGESRWEIVFLTAGEKP
jgi:hypothetical protein